MRINPRLKNDLKKFLIEKIKAEKSLIKVKSSYSLDRKEKELIIKKFPALNWSDAQYVVDESIIAGIIINVGSRIIDMSLKGALSNLQNTIYESN